MLQPRQYREMRCDSACLLCTHVIGAVGTPLPTRYGLAEIRLRMKAVWQKAVGVNQSTSTSDNPEPYPPTAVLNHMVQSSSFESCGVIYNGIHIGSSFSLKCMRRGCRVTLPRDVAGGAASALGAFWGLVSFSPGFRWSPQLPSALGARDARKLVSTQQAYTRRYLATIWARTSRTQVTVCYPSAWIV